jgi:hypothetical protein
MPSPVPQSNTTAAHRRESLTSAAPVRACSPSGLVHSFRALAARVISHETPRLMCPPGPVPLGEHPPIIISSLMRSGTHLLMDLLLNNLPEYRQEPLYVDFDQYVFRGHDRSRLLRAGSCLIKTHAAQRPFDESVQEFLRDLGARGLVIIPQRSLDAVRASMAKWSRPLADEVEDKQILIWQGMEPLMVDFQDLLDLEAARALLETVRSRLGLPAAGNPPVLAAGSTSQVLWDKLQTRLRGARAGRLNTTIGYRLPAMDAGLGSIE